MTIWMPAMLAGASLFALASSVQAQTTDQSAVPAAADEVALGEIVVTARRKSESLQDIPQSLTAITSDTLQKLNIQRFEDVSAVTPGLSLTTAASGFSTTASVRGVTFQSESSASPTLAFYLNDAPVEATTLFQSLFDVGQIEVLRGPQGTVRGISAPSGAITVTTRRPNLSEYGGYINATITDLQGRNVNGAVNVPVIKDVLGLRVAALIDNSDFDGVRSLNNPLRPKQTTSAIRTSLSFEPNDSFNLYVSYLNMDRALESFAQVSGPGAGYNGPAIAPDQRLSVNDELSHVHQHFDVVTAQIDSRLWGQRLSYVGAYAKQKTLSRENVDRGNVISDFELFNYSYVPQERTSHEIRLSSEAAPGRFLDYTVGGFYQWIATDTDIVQPRLFSGFFGDPRTPSPFTANPRFVSPLNIFSPVRSQEISLFGSLTAHFGENTEFTAGGRQIFARVVRTSTNTFLPGGFTAVPATALGGSCGALASSYPGYCDQPVSGLAGVPGRLHVNEQPFIYNLSLSHRFSRDFMVYANHGTSWRYGPAVIGITNGFNPNAADPSLRQPDPVLTGLSSLRAETSRSYEVGFKSTLLDGRARLNVALFRQTFNNLIIRTEPVRYLSYDGRSLSPTTFNFTTQVPAVIEGFDIDTALQITPDWNVTAAVSYADGQIENGLVPCNGVIPAGQRILMCQTNGSASRDPYWSATVTSEYVRPLHDNVDGFVRGLFTYYPENTRRSVAQVIDSYNLLNLYAGLRSDDGAWEVALFAKNAFKTEETLSRDAVAYTVSGNTLPGTSGYFGTTFTPRREVGVNVRYAFGSR
ncbi:TonB-dependent receptor [Phenylobacterium sp. LjRoot219]|uniref:TonB-dependent receptor n=1 Tax=Phenylobacterium sp. LjRoot219 TaxID=3342283 RepID=UPI003ECFDBA0